MIKITEITIACHQLSKMKAFYGNLFKIKFQEMNIEDYYLYKGKLGGIVLILCPAALANNTAKQNRHQMTIEVDDLSDIVAEVKMHGGIFMSELYQESNVAEIYDPDQNSIVITKSANITSKKLD